MVDPINLWTMAGGGAVAFHVMTRPDLSICFENGHHPDPWQGKEAEEEEWLDDEEEMSSPCDGWNGCFGATKLCASMVA